MLDSTFIIEIIQPYLNSKREISAFEFNDLFSSLNMQEQYEVIKIMIENNIEYVDEKEEENQNLKNIEVLKVEPKNTNYQALMNLTNEELCKMYQVGDKNALVALVEKNKRFIYNYVLKCKKIFSKCDFTDEDFYEEGIIGLAKGAEKFDISLGYSFLTYSGYWIEQKMRRAVADQGYIIRLPVHMHESISRVMKYRKKYPNATNKELLEIINKDYLVDKRLSLDKLNELIMYGEIYYNTISLNAIVGEQSDSELIDFITDDISKTPEEEAEQYFLKEEIDLALSQLKKREREIIEYRFGINNKEKLTLEEIGKMFNVTRERIRQIESNALRKLRHPVRNKLLKDFYE